MASQLPAQATADPERAARLAQLELLERQEQRARAATALVDAARAGEQHARREQERERARAEAAEARVAELDDALAEARRDLDAAHERYGQLRGRKVVRIGLAATAPRRTLRRLVLRLRRR